MEWTKLIKPNRSIGNPSVFDDRLPDDAPTFQNNNKDGPNGHQEPCRIGDDFVQLSGEFQGDTPSSASATTANINVNSASAAEQKAAAVRRVSISRSGRYKSKNKQRARLPSSETAAGDVLTSPDVTPSGPNSVPRCADIFGKFGTASCTQQAAGDSVKPEQSTTPFSRSQSQPNDARSVNNTYVGNFSTTNRVSTDVVAAELRRQNQNSPVVVNPCSVVAAKSGPNEVMNSSCTVDDEEPAPLQVAFESTDL